MDCSVKTKLRKRSIAKLTEASDDEELCLASPEPAEYQTRRAVSYEAICLAYKLCPIRPSSRNPLLSLRWSIVLGRQAYARYETDPLISSVSFDGK
jgi:hypothetical protein